MKKASCLIVFLFLAAYALPAKSASPDNCQHALAGILSEEEDILGRKPSRSDFEGNPESRYREERARYDALRRYKVPLGCEETLIEEERRMIERRLPSPLIP